MAYSSNNILVDLTFDFALRIIDFTEQIKEQKNTGWQTSYLDQEQVLEPTLVKHKMQKVKQILSISLK